MATTISNHPTLLTTASPSSGTAASTSAADAATAGAAAASSVLRTAPDLRIACLGNVDSGKSTLVGVLSKFVLDDGRGSARAHVLQHRHEKEKGQTSAVALELLGFDAGGAEVHPGKLTGRHVKDLRDVASRSARCVTLVDLCGHEHFLRTTVYGLTGYMPDMVFIVIGANAGVQKMTREHLGLTVALGLPCAIIISKIDMAPKNVLDDTMRRVDRVIRLASRKKYLVESLEEAATAASTLTSGVLAPVFHVSSTTGQGLDLLRKFISELACGGGSSLAGRGIRGGDADPDASASPDDEDSTEMIIDNTYIVDGVGIVVAGSLVSGTLRIGQTMLLGPDASGEYKPVRVQSVHRQCVPVDVAHPGQQLTVAIKVAPGTKHKADVLRRGRTVTKGMVMLSEKRAADFRARHPTKGLSVRAFAAEIKVLHHSTTIQEGFSPVVHIGTVRQSAVIQKIIFPENVTGDQAVLRTGGTATVHFRFGYRPEFVKVGSPLVMREGTTKGVGRVVQILE